MIATEACTVYTRVVSILLEYFLVENEMKLNFISGKRSPFGITIVFVLIHLAERALYSDWFVNSFIMVF